MADYVLLELWLVALLATVQQSSIVAMVDWHQRDPVHHLHLAHLLPLLHHHHLPQVLHHPQHQLHLHLEKLLELQHTITSLMKTKSLSSQLHK